jgi:cation:H+ antiporter
MLDLSIMPLYLLLLSFAVAAAVIAFAGIKLAHSAEIIAYESGIGQAVVGAVFLGVSTSISGSILSFYAASQAAPALAISNAIGGIAAQTAFLVIADLSFRKANLEHAASSLDNLLQTTLLIILLAMALLASSLPDWTLWSLHPASLVLVLMYVAGLYIVRGAAEEPYWSPKRTAESQQEKSKKRSKRSTDNLGRVIVVFIALALLLAVSGVALAETALELSTRTGMSETMVGGLLTSVVTSLPELITVLAAVQRGALNLAVGDIIGGNSFDVLFLAGSDWFYRAGSIYHQFTTQHAVLLGTVIIMSGFLSLGLLRRQKQGPANIGFESVTVLALYLGFIAYTIFYG